MVYDNCARGMFLFVQPLEQESYKAHLSSYTAAPLKEPNGAEIVEFYPLGAWQVVVLSEFPHEHTVDGHT